MKITAVLFLVFAVAVYSRSIEENIYEGEPNDDANTEYESASESAEGSTMPFGKKLGYAQAPTSSPSSNSNAGQQVETQQPDQSGIKIGSGNNHGQGQNTGPTSAPNVSPKELATNVPTPGQYNGPTPTIPAVVAAGSGCYAAYTSAPRATNNDIVNAHIALKNCLTSKCDMNKCKKHKCTGSTSHKNVKCWYKWYECITTVCSQDL